MKLQELFAQIPVLSWNADLTLEVNSVSSDSRKIESGAAFVCLKGLKVDGRVWIPQSFEKGAVVAICQEKPEVDVPYVLVEDTRAVLPLLLSNFYGHPERSFRRIIGITGTNGKTTTSFMMKAIFDRAGCKTGLIGTTKYLVCDEEFPVDAGSALLTTPDPELLFRLFSAMREKGVDTVIMEASSHALALRKLTGVPFDVGVFTNLTQDHIDFHKTMDEYLEAKKGLFQVAKKGIFNCDDNAFDRISANVSSSVTTYSAKGSGDYAATKILSHDDKGIAYRLKCGAEEKEIYVAVPGSFTVYNSLAAIATAREEGIAWEPILEALAEMSGVKGRIERIPTKTPYSVFIDFAHTPDALENILKNLREFTTGRLITLFGCGGDRDKTKRPIMGAIACRLSDFVVITSDNCRSEKKEDIIRDIVAGAENAGCQFITITDRTEAIKYALDHAQPGDVILLAGKGHEEYEIDQNGKHEYSERKIVLEHIGE